MKTFLTKILIATALLIVWGCSSAEYPPLDTVDKVDIQRYLGKWYEIALLPNSFEEGCNCTTAEYSLIDSTTVRVVNSCRQDSVNGEINTANGKAFVVEGSNNSKLRVQFFWPFRGDYWIIDLDKENYTYAVVGSPSRKYLWILARTPQMDESLYDKLLEKCGAKGFDISKVIRTNHDCN